jgi:acetyl-CoA acetyltransferase
MEDVVIVSGVRTAIGRFQAASPTSDLAAAVIKAVERAGGALAHRARLCRSGDGDAYIAATRP